MLILLKMIVIDVRRIQTTYTLQQTQAADDMCLDVRTTSCRMLVLMNPRQPLHGLHLNQNVSWPPNPKAYIQRRTSVTGDETL